MIVLDTDVLSALMRMSPDPAVIEWLDRQVPELISTTSITVNEIETGIAVLTSAHRRSELQCAFKSVVDDEIGQRILPFDHRAASEAARLGARLRREGQPIESWDLQIAGIAIARRSVLATGNTKHFSRTGVKLVNPWKDLS